MLAEQIDLFNDGASPYAGKKAIIVLSGGQDSTTCLFLAKKLGFELHAVTFDYNQRHSIEIEAAKRVAKRAGVTSHEIIAMGPILQGSSPLVSENALHQYKDAQSLPGGLENTFVPLRNQLFLTIAANRAYVKNCGYIFTGVAEEDFGGYPDCRHEFILAMQDVCNKAAFTGENGAPNSLQILTPLMNLTKAETVKLAMKVPGAYAALAWTHTAYDGHYPPTGHDHASLLRAKGFEQAGVPDPLVVRAWLEELMHLPQTKNYSDTQLYWSVQEIYGEDRNV